MLRILRQNDKNFILVEIRDVRGMKNFRKFPLLPGIARMGMKNPRICIIPVIPHSPGKGMNFIRNPEN